jgi:hypothetical protein
VARFVRMAHDTLLEVLHDADLLSAAVRAHVLEAVKHVGEARALRTNVADGPYGGRGPATGCDLSQTSSRAGV